MKIKPKFEYKCVYFNGVNKEEIIELLKEYEIKILEWTTDSYEYMNYDYDYDTRVYYTIYYINQWNEPKKIELDNDVYVWIDEHGEINFCIKEYLDENFEIIKE